MQSAALGFPSSISTAAEAPSDSCDALPAVMNLPSFTTWPSANTGFRLAKTLQCGVGAVAFILATQHSSAEVAPVALSVDQHVGRQGDDLGVEPPGLLARAAVRCCERSAYSSCASGANVVAIGDHLRRFDHCHVEPRNCADQRRVLAAVAVDRVGLHQGDRTPSRRRR